MTPPKATSERARRLAVRKRAKDARNALQAFTRVLAEWERLEGADAVGLVQIPPEDAEGDYAADVLDLVAQAKRDAGRTRVVEVFVITAADSTTHSAPEAHRKEPEWHQEHPPQDSTQTRERKSARTAPSSSGASPTALRG